MVVSKALPVIARSEATKQSRRPGEAIQPSPLDCFACARDDGRVLRRPLSYFASSTFGIRLSLLARSRWLRINAEATSFSPASRWSSMPRCSVQFTRTRSSPWSQS